MSERSLSKLLAGLHDDIQQRLKNARECFAHPGSKGDASESVWLELLQNYLPKRYEASKAHVVDSEGNFSDQIDVVIFDRQYSPFIFTFKDQTFIPAESVYAVFEAKQTVNAGHIEYAQRKIASVRRLHRTSLEIPHAGGVYPPKPPISILGGILTFESDWSPSLGEPLRKALDSETGEGQIDLGCFAAHGFFHRERSEGTYHFECGPKPATAFLFKLIAELQFSGTVPMIDVLAYSRWLSK